MGKFVFSVPDISCNHCKMRISKALEAAGVKEFEVSVEEKRVTAEAEDAASVKAVIEDAGYDATLV
ncbi:MAG: cation transporter [Synergistota bacterium]|jgi:copper chaperone CopZ|nr:cation transporter [Synergistota bacterium]OPZ37955.1 MAG: copper exporting ATPase [Synergistetes bacterium ADurb.BinA166]